MPDCVWIRTHVIDRLLSLPGRPWEVGGWLLGFADGDELVVTHATPPGAPGSPLHVRISGRGHRPHFDRLWDETGGVVTYLGDWHSHPGGPAAPSDRDRRAVQMIASDPDFATPRPLIVIAATPRWPTRREPRALGAYRARAGQTLEAWPIRPFDDLVEVAAGSEPWPDVDSRGRRR